MEVRRPHPPAGKTSSKSALKRLMLALPISVLVHVIVAIVMRPEYRDVSDFAVEFHIVEMAPGAPPKGAPDARETPPEPQPESEATPEPEIAKKAPQLPKGKDDLALPSSPKTDKIAAPVPEGVPEGRDAGVGSGICMHDLFAFSDVKPEWMIYISMASFRGTIYQKELGNTFRSFDLGRRLIRYMGLDPADEVEALLVTSKDIFDWRGFEIVASYDSGEEQLKGRMTEALKRNPYFKWKKQDGGFEGRIPGEFEWTLIGAGRVFTVAYAPPLPASGVAEVELPANPFSDTDEGANDSEGGDVEKGASTGPVQVSCIVAAEPKKQKSGVSDITELAKEYLLPDAEGHFPVALLATSDPRAVGIGRRLGRRLGFNHAVIRGYFTEPVRIEGILSFSKDETGVQRLADMWMQEAKHYAADPLFALAGVSHLLRNLEIKADGTEITFSMMMRERQVISTLLFLQLQGKALERQLKSNQ
jgi:hypothetical protein